MRWIWTRFGLTPDPLCPLPDLFPHARLGFLLRFPPHDRGNFSICFTTVTIACLPTTGKTTLYSSAFNCRSSAMLSWKLAYLRNAASALRRGSAGLIHRFFL